MEQTYTIAAFAKEPCDKSYSDLIAKGLTFSLTPDKSGCYQLDVTNTGQTTFSGIVRLDMTFCSDEPAFFMPAFLYNRNRSNVPPYCNAAGEYLPFPRLALKSSLRSASDFWTVRGDRLSHPVSIAVNGETVYAIAVQPVIDQPCQFNGFGCRLGENQSAVSITLGYENAPGLYLWSGSDLLADPMGCISLAPGQSLRIPIYLFCEPASDNRKIHDIIRHVYTLFHQPPRKGSTVEEAVQDIAQAIFQDAYVHTLKTYSTRVFLQNGAVVQEPLASISWTGGLEVAAPMLYSAARLERPDIRRQALESIGYIVENSLNSRSGLPFDAYDESGWYTQGWWDEHLAHSGHSSYLVGQALYYLLMAYDVESHFFGVKHPEWLGWVRDRLEVVERTKNPQGEVPHIWSAEDGSALEYDSFSGCWCVAAAVYYGVLAGDPRYMQTSIRSLLHYYDAYVKRAECYGTPHDTRKAVDSEGVLSFIKACRFLHEQTGEERFLQMLGDSLCYEFTFKFCWNPPIQTQPLKRLGWSSCGGSVTSTANPHIHPMSNNVTDEIAYYYVKTGDKYFLSRLLDTADWALQTYSRKDGEYDYGKKGWMSERFCYSQALLVERYEDGTPCSTWRCFLPWGASNILEGLCGTVWTKYESLKYRYEQQT